MTMPSDEQIDEMFFKLPYLEDVDGDSYRVIREWIAPILSAAVEAERQNHTFCPHCNPCRKAEVLNAAEDALRSLALYVSVGGYNASEFDPKQLEKKIRWGIDHIITVEREREKQRWARICDSYNDHNFPITYHRAQEIKRRGLES